MSCAMTTILRKFDVISRNMGFSGSGLNGLSHSVVATPRPDRRIELVPKGPNGERRPGDVIGAAVMVMRIATGEVEDSKKSGRTRSGLSGAAARANKLNPAQRSEIARKAAAARWG
jgi:hypothetical protein